MAAAPSAASDRASNRVDPSTLSNFHDVRVTKMHLTWRVDFESKVIHGKVEYQAVVESADGASELVLDTNHLDVERVTSYGDVLEGDAAFGSEVESQPYGRALRVPLGSLKAEGESVECTVEYRTTAASSAVQFLEASQTKDKEAPFLFTQCQAIHARSLLPCQDTPGVKCAYSAEVTVPDGITPVMSALPGDADGPKATEDGQHVFAFDQPVPVPSYLVALAAGKLERRPLAGEDTMGVWAEPSVVDAAAEEFAETPAFVRAGEELMGPYEWGRYDLLVLPPTFPYGGMENPCLTFVTPTLLAGDKSLADVVAHEICHSWAGNLVTCATWEHFWLNEGATMMAQRFIVAAVSEASASPHWGKLRGMRNFHFDAARGEDTLESTVRHFEERGQAPYTALIPELSGVDPDDSFSSVPYEKGFLLFDAIRRLVGDARFKTWFKSWFQTFRRESVTSQELRDHVTAHFGEGGDGTAKDGEKPVDLLKGIDWDTWFFAEGAAPSSPLTWEDEGVREGCEALAQVWAAVGEGESTAMASWAAGQKIVFLDAMIAHADKLRESGTRLSARFLAALDESYGFGSSSNCEILFRWLSLRIASADTKGCLEATVDFLKQYGRMKYVRPLFSRLLKDADGRERAVALAEELKSFYHPICAKVVEADVKIETAKPAIGAGDLEVAVTSMDTAEDPEAEEPEPDSSSAAAASASSAGATAERGPALGSAATFAPGAKKASSSAAEETTGPSLAPTRSTITAQLRRDQARMSTAAPDELTSDEQAEARAVADRIVADAKGTGAAGKRGGSKDGFVAKVLEHKLDKTTSQWLPSLLAGVGIAGAVILAVYLARQMRE